MRAFNRMLQNMSLKGTVKIGKTSSLETKTLVVLAHDANGLIVDASIMKVCDYFAASDAIICFDPYARIPFI